MKTPFLTLSASAVVLSAPASAQTIDWAEFVRDDARMVATSAVGLGDTEEKDFAFGDFDNDGWTDLVSVRKQPFTTTGRRVNVLFMNEGGMLVDRSAQYASTTDVAGDMGFLTPTNDRDVAVGDFDGDGWLDFVTATTFTPNETKELSHPRIYMNLGEVGGVWQGFMYQEARIPDWGTYPNMCGVAVGDVTGDGAVDIYFSHYEQMAQVDLNDRLLVNDGTGYFVDESSLRMSPSMLGSSFGTAAVIADMNNDGVQDVISVSGSGQTGGLTRSSVAYNNPNNEGFFNLLQEPYTGAPYHVAVGDLNGDTLLDMILSDDSDDRYLLNEGNDPFGRVDWSPAYTFNTDDGFGSNNYIVDLDGDGFSEAIICDVDVDLSGCSRRMHVFHNRGGVVGGFVNLDEEREGTTFYGAMGLPRLRGVHDVAIFDIDNDGDLDMVVGRCADTRIYMNQRDELGTNYCPAVANSSGNPADIGAIGSPMVADNDLTLVVSDLPQSVFGYFLVGSDRANVPNAGGSIGTLCIGGSVGRYSAPGQIMDSGAMGSFSLALDLTFIPFSGGVVSAQAGETYNFTTWFRDSVLGIATSNFSNAVSVELR